jgi:6-phosphogluconolactonase
MTSPHNGQRFCILSLSLLMWAVIPANAQSSFAYVANSGSPSSISGYTLSPNGTLTPVPGSPFAAGTGGNPDTNSVAIDPFGNFVYATNENDDTISAWRIDPSTGGLVQVPGSPFAAAGAGFHHANSVKVHPSGRFLYVPIERDHTIFAYAINSSTGALTPLPGSPFPITGATGANDSIALDPSGHFLYVTNNQAGGHVFAFTIDPGTGALAMIAGSPFSAGDNPDSVIVDPSGRFVYAGNFISEDISAYSINSSTGALTPIGTFAAGGSADEVTVDPSRRFLYTANDGMNIGPPGVGAFRINQSTGALTTITGSPFAAGAEPSGVTVDPTGRFLLVANESSNDVSSFIIDPSTGALTAVAGSPFAAGSEPVKIAITAVVRRSQIRYFTNLNIGDSFIDITNTGASSNGSIQQGPPNSQVNINGSICVNIYVFAADEQEVACCSCLVTPNGLYSASVKTALLNSTLTPSFPNEVVIKLISSIPLTGAGGVQTCNPASPTNASVTSGLLAWGTTVHGFPTATGPSFQMTETPFGESTLSEAELARDVQECQFIQVLGSGQFGICKGCQNVGLGAAGQ